MRLQIAFDYLMVSIFVLLIFTIIYATIAKQRVETSNEQAFAQLQLIAQSIAGQITTASQAGSGYNATVTLPGDLSLLYYNVSITKYGTVIVSSNTFGQSLHAYAISSAYSIVSNATYLSSNGIYYTIPTFTGSGFITLQNSFGTICIDYTCPSSSAQPAHLSTTVQVTKAISLNGPASAVLLSPNNAIPAIHTISMWIDPTSSYSLQNSEYVFDEGTSGADQNWIKVAANAIYVGTDTNAAHGCSNVATPLLQGNWYFITYEYDGASVYVYVNGNILAGCTTTGVPGYASNSINLGRPSEAALVADSFNGLITNVQVYSSALNSNQISTLYNRGIAASPVSAYSPSAWWPLNGNPNDYSGSGLNLFLNGTVSYQSVAQINAYVTGNNGAYASNVLVGFSATLGNFSNDQSTYGVTNATGVTTAFLRQYAATGTSGVTVTMFNGNASTSSSLVGWWPLNNGQGNKAYDISRNSNAASPETGMMSASSWASPNYVSSFDGQSGYIQVPDSSSLQLSTVTLSAWVDVRGQGNSYIGHIISKQGAYDVGVCGSNLYVCYYNWGGRATVVSSSGLAENTWYMVTAVISPGAETVYVNGIPVMSGASTVNTQSYGLTIGQAAQQFFNGSVSNAQAYSSDLTQQQINQLYSEGIGGAPLVTGTLAGWWPLNGDAGDYSGNGNNGAIYGGVQSLPYAAQQQLGASQALSGQFNGHTSSITVNTVPAITTGNFTIATWVKYIGPSGTGLCQGIFGDWPDPGTGFQLIGAAPSGGCGPLYVDNQGLNWPGYSNMQIPANSWIFVVAQYNGATGRASIYLNNVLYTTGALPAGLNLAQGADAYLIGADAWASGRPTPDSFNGNISNLQLYNTVLNQQQLTQLYQEGMFGLPLTSSGLLAWYPLSGNANDYSSYGYTANQVQNVAYAVQDVNPPYSSPSLGLSGATFSGYGTSSTGSGGGITISNSVQDTGPITLAAWVYPYSLGLSGRVDVIAQGPGAAGGGYELSIGSGGTHILYFGQSFSGGWINPGSTANVPLNSWSFVAATWDGNYAKMYINGALSYNGVMSGSRVSSSSPTLIGYWTGGYNYFNGTIADAQIYNTALTQQQISQLYNAGIPQSSSTSVSLGVTP